MCNCTPHFAIEDACTSIRHFFKTSLLQAVKAWKLQNPPLGHRGTIGYASLSLHHSRGPLPHTSRCPPPSGLCSAARPGQPGPSAAGQPPPPGSHVSATSAHLPSLLAADWHITVVICTHTCKQSKPHKSSYTYCTTVVQVSTLSLVQSLMQKFQNVVSFMQIGCVLS